MVWLNILDNQSMQIAAEMLVIVVGSMLLGVLLTYVYYSSAKRSLAEAQKSIQAEKEYSTRLQLQNEQLQQSTTQLQQQLQVAQSQQAYQNKLISDQNSKLIEADSDRLKLQSNLEALQADLVSTQERMQIIEDEFRASEPSSPPPRESTLRANYDHVSQLLGKPVTENDLTLVLGIGPKTSALLQQQGIDSWDLLANTPVDQIHTWLEEAGGVYKAQDPTHWPKQARMAAAGEWRKLRAFQEGLRQKSG